MWKAIVIGIGITAPTIAMACPKTAARAEASLADVQKDPAACAKKADLIGSNCSYTTGNMASRVIEQGTSWSYTGTLAATENQLDSHVAAPFAVGPQGSVKLVANTVLEDLTNRGADSRVTLEGKLLEVDGVKYAVLTGFSAPTS